MYGECAAATFRLSISARVILRGLAAAPDTRVLPAARGAAEPLLDVRVSPARALRWSTEHLSGTARTPACGPDELDGPDEPDRDFELDAFDIRLGWGDGGCTEYLNIPLSAADTLIVDECGSLQIYDVCDARPRGGF